MPSPNQRKSSIGCLYKILFDKKQYLLWAEPPIKDEKQKENGEMEIRQ